MGLPTLEKNLLFSPEGMEVTGKAKPCPQGAPGCLQIRLTQISCQGLERGLVGTGAFLEDFLEREWDLKQRGCCILLKIGLAQGWSLREGPR